MSSNRRPRFTRVARIALAALVACALAASAAGAAGESRWQGGGDAIVSVSRGSLKSIFGTGAGIEPFGVYRLDKGGLIGVRVQGGMIDYGSEVRTPSNTRPILAVQIQTKRTAVTLGGGPQLAWPRGRFTPYAFATANAAYFTSRADFSGYDSLGNLRILQADKNTVVIGAGAGGGLGFRITETVHLDAGLEYRSYSDVETLGEGLAVLPTGDVLLPEHRGDLGMLVVRLGATVHFAPGRKPPPR
jgi:opacity protein-like surface antigen